MMTRIVKDVIERWADVPGFEGLYQVSTLGNVMSLDRWVSPRGGNKPYFIAGRQRRQHKNRRGYFKISLYKSNTPTTFEVHRLVVLAFIGPPPEDHEIRHLDGQRTNNTLSNLVYGTPTQNQQDRFEHGTACVGTKHPLCSLDDVQVNTIIDEYSDGNLTMRQLADKYEVVPSTIWRIVNGHRRLSDGEQVRVKDRNFSRSGQRRTTS